MDFLRLRPLLLNIVLYISSMYRAHAFLFVISFSAISGTNVLMIGTSLCVCVFLEEA